MMGAFCNTSFLTTIWCPKNYQRMNFHLPLFTWTYLENSWKFFFLKFSHFFKFYWFFSTFSVLNYVQKITYSKQRMNRSMFKWISSSKDDKVWTDYEKYFSESYPSYNLKEPIHLNKFLFNLYLSHFLYMI